jgi:hypothetical protein
MDLVGDRTRCIQEMTSGLRLEAWKSRIPLVAEDAKWQESHRDWEVQLGDEKDVVKTRR